MSKVLIAVSGTGGHVFPGIALAQELKARRSDLEILFAVARGKAGRRWIEAAGFEVRAVRITGFSRTPSLSWVLFPLMVLVGCVQTVTTILGEGPDLVVGTGGYVSGPFVALAATFGIPTLILEQNSVPGVATRLGARFAREIHVADEEARARLSGSSKVRVSGNPVRRSIEYGDAERFRAAHDLASDRPLVLVIGGSQGASALTEAALGAARVLGEEARVQMVVQTGERAAPPASDETVPGWVRRVGFLDDMGDAYAASSLVVARAGAMTLAELASTGRPALLVPYPFAAEDHQTANALRYARHGAAEVVPQRDLSPEALARRIEELTHDPKELERMSEAARSSEASGARERIADACESYLG